MKRYVDVYVLPVAKKKLGAYKKLAARAGDVWMKHGALQYMECVGEDLKGAAALGCVSLLAMGKAKPGETVVFAFVVYKSKAHRERVNAKVCKDPFMTSDAMKKQAMPFDMKRMGFGGFETLVHLG